MNRSIKIEGYVADVASSTSAFLYYSCDKNTDLMLMSNNQTVHIVVDLLFLPFSFALSLLLFYSFLSVE